MNPQEYEALLEKAHARLVDALENRAPDSVNAADFAAAALLIVHEISEIKDEMKSQGTPGIRLQPIDLQLHTPAQYAPPCSHPMVETRTDGTYCLSCWQRLP